MKALFNKLFYSHTESDLENLIHEHSDIFCQENWHPLGGNENNFGVIENQQSSPIAALIEKITNSIDAILMKKCFQLNIDPKSEQAPVTMQEAIEQFFPDHKDWSSPYLQKKYAEDLQILADGPKKKSSLIIYDNGEGQHPDDFENTFLSLLKGNKNEIKFVQGKYNMGGSGSIVFCGKQGYQLIASKKHDNTGLFGFTLIREHPFTEAEGKTKKNTWYEFLKIDGEIPRFAIDQLDLKLHNRTFATGTIIKLYSYDLPAGSRSVISRDLNQSINEFLFEPALPVLTVDKKERYPDDLNLERSLFGLKRRLEQEDSKYIDDYFSEVFTDDRIGQTKVTCYIFKTHIADKSVKESKASIQREFFKNNMSVLFSINGQVQGHYTSEFITRSLKFNLLKKHLLIHVDCTDMNYSFRKELFMASRDRLKGGEETAFLRDFLARKLRGKNGRLAAIEKLRRDSIAVESGDTKDLLKSFTKNMPLDSDLFKLLDQTFKLEQKNDKKDKSKSKTVKQEHREPFKSERFPSFLKLKAKNDGEKEVAKIPLGGEKTIRFDTDVENHYFDRTEEPGTLKVALLDFNRNETDGGNAPGKIESIEDVFNVDKSSPQNGTIKINLNPKNDAQVGDAIKIKVTLESPSNDFDEVFWVKITEKDAPKQPSKKDEQIPGKDDLGLPEFVMCYKGSKDNSVTWEQVEEAAGIDMDYKTVVFPLTEGDDLKRIYINMDSTVLKNFKGKVKNPNEDQLAIAERKYISSIYFHTLFLYVINKNQGYQVFKESDESHDQPIELNEYLKDVFQSYYSEFIINFGGAEELMQSLES